MPHSQRGTRLVIQISDPTARNLPLTSRGEHGPPRHRAAAGAIMQERDDMMRLSTGARDLDMLLQGQLAPR